MASPDNTCDGWLKKKWVIADGKRILLKSGSKPFFQEPLNEVLATLIMKRLNISCVEYTYELVDGFPVSTCEDFINAKTELVSAWHILCAGKKKPNHISLYEHFVEEAENIGIAGVRANLEKMLTLDFIIVAAD